MTAAGFECSPIDNPCAQCRKPIERPIWTEAGDDRVSFVWHCKACNYQFTTIAVFGHHTADDHKIAA